MVTMSRNDRHPSSGGAGKGAIGPLVFVNRMVRRWISRQAFGTERLSAAAE
jgi:hypothetical protein